MTWAGIYRVTVRDLNSPEAWHLNNEIERLRKLALPVQNMIEKLNSITPVHAVYEINNKVTLAYLTAVIDHTTDASPTPSSLLINKLAIGTGVTTPTQNDTTLETETYRNDVASLANSQNIGYIGGFFSATETSGTFREVGAFINGTASANTGTLVNRAAINITKTTLQTLTIDITLTATPA